MNKVKATALALCLTLSSAGAALAGPPLMTDDAGTVDVGSVEIELNGSYTYNKDKTDGVTTKTNAVDGELKITTGLYENLGISVAIPYLFNERTSEDGDVSNISGLGDMELELKYNFLEIGGVELAIKPTLLMPTGRYSKGLSEGRWQFGTALIATKEFEDGKYALHANFGYEYHHHREDDGSLRNNIWSGSIAGEVEVIDDLFAVADFGIATAEERGTDDLAAYALVGARYEMNDYLDIYGGVKFGLSKPEDDVAVLYGLMLKF